jgi:hypothetical protein
MAGMQVVVLILAALQIVQPQIAQPVTPATARGDRFQIAVPQGWKILTAGSDVVIEHSSGASLLVLRTDPVKNLSEYALQQAERVMTPLGFATLGDPRTFKDAHEEWIEYEIRGNRLADHRRLLYRAMRRASAYYSIVYEAPEDQFEALLTDAQGIASSVQAVIEAPPARRPVRRVAR